MIQIEMYIFITTKLLLSWQTEFIKKSKFQFRSTRTFYSIQVCYQQNPVLLIKHILWIHRWCKEFMKGYMVNYNENYFPRCSLYTVALTTTTPAKMIEKIFVMTFYCLCKPRQTKGEKIVWIWFCCFTNNSKHLKVKQMMEYATTSIIYLKLK